MSMQQGPEETLYHFKDCFRRQAEQLKDLLGDNWFNTFIRSTATYKRMNSQAERDEYEASSFEVVIATGLMCNSDRKRS